MFKKLLVTLVAFLLAGACVLAVLLAAVCATGGYALWYSSALDGALSLVPRPTLLSRPC